MGIIIRQSFWNSLSGYLGVILGALLTLWLYPLALGPDEYGLTRLLISIGMVGSTFAGLGLKNSIVRYFPYFKNPDQHHHGILFWILVLSGIGFGVILLFYWFNTEWLISIFGDRSRLFSEYHIYLIPILFSLLYIEVITAFARALQDTVFASIIKDVGLRASFIVVLLIYYVGWIDFNGFMIGFSLAYIFNSFLLLGYILLRYPQRIWPDFQFLSMKLVRSIATYSSYALMGGLTTMIVGNIDIMMLGALTDLSSTGIYAIAFYIGSVIQIPQRAIQRISYPIISDAFKEKDYPLIDSIYTRTALNQLVLGVLLLVGIYANLHNIDAILPAEFQTGHGVILAIGLAKLFDMATGINGGIILTSSLYKMDLWTTLLLVALSITMNYLLIPLYGIFGAAVATAISVFLYNVIKLIYVRAKLDMQPFDNRFLGVLAIGAVLGWLASFLPIVDPWWLDVVFRSSLITIAYASLVLFFQLSDDINHIFNSFWTKLTS